MVKDKFEGKNILVTGADGFVGGHLCNELADKCNLTALVYKKKLHGIKSIQGDITDKNRLLKLGGEYDLVFHIAGLVQKPGIDPISFFDVNSVGTSNILEFCKKNKIENLILSSTTDVYGEPTYLPVDENHPRLPHNAYGMSKLLAEIFCEEYAKRSNIDVTILRYSYIQGVGQFEKRAASIFIKNALNKEDIVIHGSGENTYDFVDVHDVIAANLLAAFNKKTRDQTFNIASGKETSINQLAETIRKLINPKIKIKHMQTGEVRQEKLVFDISKAKTVMSYIPEYSISASLREQIECAGELYR
jgi:UDP-glucose 4-epimerase